MTKFASGLAAMFVVIIMALQSIATAQEPPKKPTTPPARPAPVAPVARPRVPQQRAPIAQPAAPQQRAPVARPAIPQQRAPIAQPTVPQQRAPIAQPTVPQQRAPIAQPRVPQQRAPIARPTVPQQRAPIAQPTVPQQRAPLARQAPPIFGPAGGAARATSIRGANRATIAGQNFSIRRGSYRAYRGGHWRTFVALRALHALTVGFALYYPYAYIDVPDDYCEGWTEDGCQLSWEAVPTLEGPYEFVCVAYCPWQ